MTLPEKLQQDPELMLSRSISQVLRSEIVKQQQDVVEQRRKGVMLMQSHAQ